MEAPQTADDNATGGGLRNEPLGVSRRVPKIWKASSISGPLKPKAEEAHKKLPGKDRGRQGTVLVRKKLPWLAGPERAKGGNPEDGHPLNDRSRRGDAHEESPPPVPKNGSSAQTGRASMASLHGDPALRAIGSTPSLRTRTGVGDLKAPRTQSLTSQSRAGGKAVVGKRSNGKKPLGVLPEPAPTQNYSSSEYSTAPSSGGDELPPNLPKKDPSSYERLVDRRAVHTEQAHNVGVPRQTDAQHYHENDMSPRETARLARRGNHRRKPRQSHSEQHHSWTMPEAKTLPRRAFDAPDVELAEPPYPPPAPLAKKSTLFAMPTHLLSASSSSAYSSCQSSMSHAMIPLSAPTFPDRKPKTPVQRSNSLHRAVTGLGNLMEEAISVAQEAARKGRNEEVANILDNATVALRHANAAQTRMAAGRMSTPLVLPSQPSTVCESDSESSVAPDSDVSSIHSRAHSAGTAPTVYTKSAQSSRQPIVVDQYKPGGHALGSQRAILQDPSDVPPRRHSRDSISRTPPRLYQPPSADSIVRDFAYARRQSKQAEAARASSRQYGAASGYYHDHGESVKAQPGIRPSLSAPMITDAPLPDLPGVRKASYCLHRRRRKDFPIHYLEPVVVDDSDNAAQSPPLRKSSRSIQTTRGVDEVPRRRRAKTQPVQNSLPEAADFSYYYSKPPKNLQSLAPKPATTRTVTALKRNESDTITNNRYGDQFTRPTNERASVSKSENWRYSVDPPTLLTRDMSLRHPRRNHISLREGQGFSLGRYHRRHSIAREWGTHRKRVTAAIACLNTVFIGLISGIYVRIKEVTGRCKVADNNRLARYRASSTHLETPRTKSFWAMWCEELTPCCCCLH